MSVAVNQPFPEFELPNETGALVKKSDLVGKPTVVYFYPKDDTSGCTLEAKAFQELSRTATGVRIVGVSPDGSASHQKFANKYDLKFTLLADEKHELAEAVGVWVEKSMYGKKYMGIERTTFLLDASGNVARIWNKVKPAGHAEEVIAAAPELLGQ
jgi:peroxiredoxin Q/BCP